MPNANYVITHVTPSRDANRRALESMPNPPVVVGVPVRGHPPVQAAQAVPNGVAASRLPPPTSAEHRLNHKMLRIKQAALGVDETTNEQVLEMQEARGNVVE